MIEALGTEIFFGLIAIGTLYVIASTSPIWIPAFIVVKNRPYFLRPWLFIGTVACLSYGFLSLLFFIILVPIEAYAIFVAPQLEAADLNPGQSLLNGLEMIEDYNWLIAPLILLMASIAATFKIKDKWNGIYVKHLLANKRMQSDKVPATRSLCR